MKVLQVDADYLDREVRSRGDYAHQVRNVKVDRASTSGARKFDETPRMAAIGPKSLHPLRIESTWCPGWKTAREVQSPSGWLHHVIDGDTYVASVEQRTGGALVLKLASHRRLGREEFEPIEGRWESLRTAVHAHAARIRAGK